MTEVNPFEDLHPVIRNEEDEIRKGIFSYALRQLHGLSLEERRRWCAAIKEATAPKKRANVKKAAAEKRPRSPEVAPAVAPAEAVAVLDAAPYVASTTSVTVVEDLSQVNVQNNVENSLPQGGGGGDDKGDTAADELPTTIEESSAFISAYMRTLLDKVVGGSLNDLAVPAMRVLCLMVGVQTTARSKDALYSMLANFHFTNCARLGKRVSRNTMMQQEVELAAAMLGQKSSSRSTRSSRAAKTVTEDTAQDTPAVAFGDQEKKKKASTKAASDEAARLEKKRRKKEEKEKKKRELAAKAAAKATAPSTTFALPFLSKSGLHSSMNINNYADDSDDDYADGGVGVGADVDDDASVSSDISVSSSSGSVGDGLDVAFNERVFKPSAAGSSGGAPTSMAPRVAPTGGWTQRDVEGKIASIVHLYDPVTVAIVVKKLQQMGYREPNAAEVVEDVLTRFHAKQLILYENGIAYMMM